MNLLKGGVRGVGWLVLMLLATASASAEVTRFEITSREPFAGGKAFGNVGSYERIVGRVYYELDPKLPQNANVVDLKLARQNDEGRVELFSDLFILTPKDPSKGNGAILYDVNNRGNKLALGFFNFAERSNDPATEVHAGDGFLMRQGFTVVWSGWDGELLPGNNRLRLAPPVALGSGAPIRGNVRCEIVPTSSVTRTVVNWANHGSYRPTEKGMRTATLTHRVRPGEPRVPIPRDQWKLIVSEVKSDSPSQLPKVELETSFELEKGHLYELIYEARDPLVQGTCFTALRDLISAFKYGGGKDNPLWIDGQPTVRRAHGFGVSQSGRFLREFTYWGFNEDEQGRQVFDGLIPHVAGAGMGSFNHRFAQPTRHVTQHDHHDYPADRFPFTYETQTDPLSTQWDGILQRAIASGTAPKVMHTQSAAEYWTRSGSLTHTDPLAQRDSNVPANVRIYSFGGTQHGPADFPPKRGDGENLANPGDYRPFLRALLLALERWAETEDLPPASVHPRIESGTLVDWRQESTGFPRIPGIQYPGVIQQPSLWDYGPRWLSEQIIDRQPPESLGDYRVLVPKCDADGNERGCLSPPEVKLPVATYTGWNLRNKDAGADGELVSLQGSYIPFAGTKEQRQKTGDPRLSLAERYDSLQGYLRQLADECHRFHRAGYLLHEDIARTLEEQEKRVAPLFAKIKESQ